MRAAFRAGLPIGHVFPGQAFDGILEGLGNSIANLVVDNNPPSDPVGLFAFIGSSGIVRDLTMSGGRFTGLSDVGAIAGDSSGTIVNVHASVPTTGFGNVGGLVGQGSGAIVDSDSSGAVTGEIVPGSSSSGSPSDIGGLVGFWAGGTVTGSHASGNVTAGPGTGTGAEAVGGLIGSTNAGTLTENSYATGNVDTQGSGLSVGGLTGDEFGTVSHSYATGAVNGNQFVGGLIGSAEGSSTLSQVFATGTVTGPQLLCGCGAYGIGGLVGYANSVSITDAYATGAVIAPGGDTIGGLIGLNASVLANVYSTGWVDPTATTAGGLIGEDDLFSITNAYWDTGTSGFGIHDGVGSMADEAGVTGLTTAQMQHAANFFQAPDPIGFDFTNVWGIVDGKSFPYLTWRYPTAPQVISGTAYGAGGAAVLTAGTIAAEVNGIAAGMTSTGADGYYNMLVPSGTIAAGGTPVIAYETGANSGARVDNLTGSTTAFDVWGSTLIAPTGDATYSAASATSLQTQDAALIASAVGSLADPTTGLTNYGYIASGDFTVDQVLTLSNGLYVQAAGNITVANALTLPGANGLALVAGGALAIDAPVSVTGAGNVVLGAGYDNATVPAASILELSFGAGDSIDYGATNNGGALSIDGTPYTLLYSMGDVQAINASDAALQGNYAVATALDAATDPTTPLLWTPIGTDGLGDVLNSNNGFTGAFEGLGHTIANLTVDTGPNDLAGLFGASSGVISDIGLIGGSVSGADTVGALVGEDHGLIVASYATGTVTGSGDAIGGLVGDEHGTIFRAYATGAVSGSEAVGGLVGGTGLFAALVQDHATGTVTGVPAPCGCSPEDIGGLVGANGGLILDGYATGNVVATPGTGGGPTNVGGLAGLTSRVSSIENSYATGNVDTAGAGSGVGGLIGDDAGLVSQSYATGTVDGNEYVGGLIGFAEHRAFLTQVYATGTVTGVAAPCGCGAYAIGGLIGEDDALSLFDAYSNGAVVAQGGDTVGGLIGLIGTNAGPVANVYSTGWVDPTATTAGGLVGEDDALDITNAYWNTQTSGFGIHDGVGTLPDEAGVTGMTTAQMQHAVNFFQAPDPNGFDFTNIWGIVDGQSFPYFTWRYPAAPDVLSGTAFSDAGATPLLPGNAPPAVVSALANGSAVGTTSLGADATYYMLAPAGTLGGAQDLLAYLTGGTLQANSYVSAPPANATGTDLWGGYVRLISNAATTSAMLAGYGNALGSNTGSDFLYTGGSFASGTSLDIESGNAGGLTLDTALSLGVNTLVVDAAGAVNQSLAFSAGNLELLGANASYALNAPANTFTTLRPPPVRFRSPIPPASPSAPSIR